MRFMSYFILNLRRFDQVIRVGIPLSVAALCEAGSLNERVTVHEILVGRLGQVASKQDKTFMKKSAHKGSMFDLQVEQLTKSS